MKNDVKLYSLIIVLCFVIVFGCLFGTKKSEPKNENNVIETIESVEVKLPDSSEEEEKQIETENVENEGLEELGNIAYNGDYVSEGFELGNYDGLTYFSQIDKAWKNYPYTSTGKKSQTIGSSGCGPTSAAMVVSSIKGKVMPYEMGDLFVSHGYRSANNGTYFAAYRWVADFFDIDYQETYNINTAINLVRNNHYVIASCSSGLFTYGGHFIVIVGIDGDYLKIYDPYLYNGKFNTSTRKGKATVEGNTVIVSIENFKNYANTKGFFAFKHNGENPVQSNQSTTSNEIKYVKANGGLRVRYSPNGTILEVLPTNTRVTVYETVNGWSRIGINRWVSSTYLIYNPLANISNSYVRYVKVSSRLNIRSGAGTNYRRVGSKNNGDQVTVYEERGNWSRIGTNQWVNSSYLVNGIIKSTSKYKIKNTVGATKTLKSASIIYQKSSLSGRKYNYKKNTKIKILQNVSSSVDKVKVIATGRIGYIKNNLYK